MFAYKTSYIADSFGMFTRIWVTGIKCRCYTFNKIVIFIINFTIIILYILIAKILIALGVDEATAYKDSCKIEHDLSQKSFEKIKEFYENYKNIT